MPGLGALGIQRIGVAIALSVELHPAQQRVVHGLFVEVGVPGIMIGKVQLALEEDHPAA